MDKIYEFYTRFAKRREKYALGSEQLLLSINFKKNKHEEDIITDKTNTKKNKIHDTHTRNDALPKSAKRQMR